MSDDHPAREWNHTPPMHNFARLNHRWTPKDSIAKTVPLVSEICWNGWHGNGLHFNATWTLGINGDGDRPKNGRAWDMVPNTFSIIVTEVRETDQWTRIHLDQLRGIIDEPPGLAQRWGFIEPGTRTCDLGNGYVQVATMLWWEWDVMPWSIWDANGKPVKGGDTSDISHDAPEPNDNEQSAYVGPIEDNEDTE